MQANENKTLDPKAARILYIVIAGVLCVAAAVTGIVLSTRQKAAQNDSLIRVDNTTTEAPRQVDALPGFSAPLSGVIAKKHDMDVPVYSTTMQEYRVHCGVDINAAVGEAVRAMADGTVSDVYDDPLLGKCVKLSHSGGATTLYANLGKELAEGITKGVAVRAGQTLGCVGETTLVELADEPHLHLEMTVDGKPVDPLEYIAEASRAASFTYADEQYEN